MSEFQITCENSSSPSDLKFLQEKVSEYNFSQIGQYEYKPLTVFMRDQDNQIIGGIDGMTGLGWLHIASLWVTDDIRGSGYGKKLITAIEEEAISRGCHSAYVFTYDFQALPFYEKVGYSIYGQLDDFPVNHTRYFLKKKLNQ
ncbi:GNAT family N-acetyltransferase [Brasilonema octagenarum UFV-E1]|uniref:GNAT family N-acetyltransferase n=1 Tax=Brasilonema sennae CENA114 TaxID=415709 RepID=A0A856MMV7_9CYAN|nr:GNAT family N-acetyltransferase [Brasilonema sennae]QDL11842.1 GNAT family N-acetyltransferase [Brasilonema sennae CENA114]QDL18221.1 GNAT family N-acetyltransferase [Brasilonema octagenarum UFV-E1]